VREEDVRAAAAMATQVSAIRIHAPRAGCDERIAGAIPLSPRRRSIATNLRRSQELTVPVTLTTTTDEFKAQAGGIVPAYTDIVACLAGRVLLRHPGMCVRWTPEHDALIPVGEAAIDIGIAVDTVGGLIVPVVRDAGRSSLLALAEASRGVIDRARDGRLTGDVTGSRRSRR
jgi:pyruvate/2-oxoglutarate dehydrogenase complex dihydrolipoamide acyltransferase (E2) component